MRLAVLVCVDIVYLLLSPMPVGGFLVSLHLEITEKALSSMVRVVNGAEVRFSAGAIRQINRANALVDLVGAMNPSNHFLNELFEEASSRLVNQRKKAVDTATRSRYRARRALGSALHTVQDYYAHSNHIETGRQHINMNLGRTVLADPAPSEAFCEGDKPGSLLTGVQNITTAYWLGAIRSLICVQPPSGKCNHGFRRCSGINKDSRDHPLADQAFDAAVEATIDFVDQVLDGIGFSSGNNTVINFMGDGTNLRSVRS